MDSTATMLQLLKLAATLKQVAERYPVTVGERAETLLLSGKERREKIVERLRKHYAVFSGFGLVLTLDEMGPEKDRYHLLVSRVDRSPTDSECSTFAKAFLGCTLEKVEEAQIKGDNVRSFYTEGGYPVAIRRDPKEV